MIRVLVIGYEPDAVDLSDPLVPDGITAEKVAHGLEVDQRKIEERGWEGQHLLITTHVPSRPLILEKLGGTAFDCIVIGGGIRVTSKHVNVLEEVVDAVRDGAPSTPIAFNEGPDTSADAAARVLARLSNRGSESGGR